MFVSEQVSFLVVSRFGNLVESLTKHIGPSTKHVGLSTKHVGLSTKHIGPSTKHMGLSTKHIEGAAEAQMFLLL